MSNEDRKPEAQANGSDNAMSATGMFQGSFRTEPDPFEKPSAAFAEEVPLPAHPAPPRPAPAVSGGEFTQLFGSRSTVAKPHVPPVAPFEPASEATRILSAPAGVPKVKGFSSPGGSDSASGEGSFTQLFRSPAAEVPPHVAPPSPQVSRPAPVVDKREWSVNFETETNRKPVSESPGVTELFRALSTNDQNRAQPLAEEPISFSPVRPVATPLAPPTHPAESFTAILQKLTEATPVARSFNTLQPAVPAVAAPAAGQGEYTRIIAADGTKALGTVPAPQEAAETKVFPVKLEMPKVAAPKLSAPALAPPKTKLQEMVPLLLVLNAFLMFVLIVLAIFFLLRK